MTVESKSPTGSFNRQLLDFLAYIELERGLSRNTLQSYRCDLLQFGSFLAERGLDARDVGPAQVSEFLTELATPSGGAEPVVTSTIQRKTAALRSFYRHLRREGIRDSDPTANLSPPRKRQKLPQVLGRAEVQRLLEQPQ
jgi:integrase/recombinase XerD